jgi:hypothetical protein
MKKIFFVFMFALLIAACTGSKKDKQAGEDTMTEGTSKQFVTYQYKVAGLQDSVVSDSIWRIIFQVGGIDKLVLSRDDSMAIFTVDPDSVDNALLEKEIVSRGGILIK